MNTGQRLITSPLWCFKQVIVCPPLIWPLMRCPWQRHAKTQLEDSGEKRHGGGAVCADNSLYPLSRLHELDELMFFEKQCRFPLSTNDGLNFENIQYTENERHHRVENLSKSASLHGYLICHRVRLAIKIYFSSQGKNLASLTVTKGYKRDNSRSNININQLVNDNAV